MKEFKLVSKGSVIGLLIKIIVFTLLVNQAFNFIERIIGQNPIINWVLIILTIIYLIFSNITDKTTITVNDKQIINELTIGFPPQFSRNSFDLDKIEKIRLIQTHDFVYGKKSMELIDRENNRQTIDLKLRYYQLVKLQEYFNDKLNIETSLIG